MYSAPHGSATRASFDSAAPTNPTGMPTIATGLAPVSPITSSSRNRAVGALPMATTEPSRRPSFCHRSTAAAALVLPRDSAMADSRGSLMWQTTWVCSGRRLRMMPVATIEESHRIGAPDSSAWSAAPATPGVKAIMSAIAGSAAAWIMRTTTCSTSSGKRSRLDSSRMISKERA